MHCTKPICKHAEVHDSLLHNSSLTVPQSEELTQDGNSYPDPNDNDEQNDCNPGASAVPLDFPLERLVLVSSRH